MKLQCIVSTDIEIIRNGMQMNLNSREVMFKLFNEILRRGLKGHSMVVSEGVAREVDKDEIREIL